MKCKTSQTAYQVVLVIDAWTAPVPYTRAWCLWEAFNAHKTGAKFDIALPPREEESLADAIAKDASEVLPTLCKIEAAHATSSRIEDQQKIFKAIEGIAFIACSTILLADKSFRLLWILCTQWFGHQHDEGMAW